MLLAFLTLLGVIVLVAVVGFFMLRKGPEIIQGQAEVTEYFDLFYHCALTGEQYEALMANSIGKQ